MSRWAKKYTEEQKTAVVAAMLEGGLTAPAAVKAAREGLLPGIAAFEMPVTTARDLRGKERSRRADTEATKAAADDPSKATKAMATALLGQAHLKLKAMRDPSWDELRQAARAVEAIKSATREPSKTIPKQEGTEPQGDKEGLVARLAQQQANTDDNGVRVDADGNGAGPARATAELAAQVQQALERGAVAAGVTTGRGVA